MKIAHINPDNYLDTDSGRVWTPERSKLAWEAAYSDFETVLEAHDGNVDVYIVFGVQGSGKTTWINRHIPLDKTVYFDAALPAKKHRARSIEIAKHYTQRMYGVWISVPLDIAISQNKTRPTDEQVPVSAMYSVFEQLEPPEYAEGFDDIVIVNVDP